jgi:multimeric flavodoxin WrbA
MKIAALNGSYRNMGHVTALLKTFLERICLILARPGRQPLPGCPEPRTGRKTKAVVIVSSGLILPILRRFCDRATPLIKDVCRCSLNARLAGRLYAGGVEKRGAEYYAARAFRLGRRLAR